MKEQLSGQEADQQHEFDVLMKEMHYHNTMNAFVELIVLYGWDTVIGDLRACMSKKEWGQ